MELWYRFQKTKNFQAGKKTFLGSKKCKSRQPIDCTFSEQLFEKTGNPMHFFWLKVITMELWYKIRLEKKIGQKNLVGSKKCKSRQPIDCTFWSNFSKKLEMTGTFFGWKWSQWSSDNDSTRNRPNFQVEKTFSWARKNEIETAYRLYFLKQLFEKTR